MLGAVDRVCPLLGLAGDRRVAVDGVDGGHRCHAEEPPLPLERPVQAQLCLTAAHERCERYLQFASRTGSVDPGRSRVADGFVTTRLLLAPQPAWRGIAGRARSSRTVPWVAAAAGIAVLGVAGVVLATPLLREPTTDVVARTTPSPSATPRVTPTPTVSPTTEPTSTPVPTASPTPDPTPVPATPVPTPDSTPAPTPAPQRTYVVAEGDTLAAIAERFGTSVGAVQAANGIDDPNEIVIGQVLVIP
jgi:LysM repeat protein